MNDLILIKQLPIIEEQLKSIKGRIEEQVASALAMPCTEETVKQVKTVRAALSKDFQELESRRKEVKSKILSPYEQFEAVYKSCVTDVYKPADDQLKAKVADVENGVKKNKQTEVKAYFEEYRTSKQIDFVTFNQSGITVTLTASRKSLKEQAKLFLDKIADELALIDTQEHAPEILVEYRKTLQVAQAITTVTNRHKAIDEERRRKEQAQAAAVARVQAAEKVTAAIAAPPPVAVPNAVPAGGAPTPLAPAPAAVPVEAKYRMTFTITDTLARLKQVKEFLLNGGYDFE